MTLPNPRETPFVDAETAGRFLKVGRSKAYELCRRYLDTNGAEGIPTLEFGRAIRVPTAALWALAGLDPERDVAEPPEELGASVTSLDPHQKDHHDGTPRPAA